MKTRPLVSVLMPVYNAERFIQEAIRSLLNQTYTNWELLILNDGSTDKTAEVINTFNDSRINYFEQNKNIGYLKSCNLLFQKTKGEFLSFLDADDTCSALRLASCLRQFELNPDLNFITTDFNRISEVHEITSEHETTVDYGRYATDPMYQPIVCCATTFLRTDMLKQVGGYHPFFEDIGGEDYHWLFRLSVEGKGSHLNEKLYNYRTHPLQSHHLNQNPLKYYFSEIDKEIRYALITENKDLLKQDADLKKRWLEKIKTNTSDLLFKQASSMLNRNEIKKATGIALSAIVRSPFSFTSWYRFLYLVYSAAMR